MSCEPSVDPLSATTTSPTTPSAAKERLALRMQVARVSASFRQGRTTENSTAAGGVRDSASAATELPVGALGSALVAEVVALGDVMTDRSFLSGPTGPVRRATG